MSDLEAVLQFIEDFEQNHRECSAYEIANRLRGHTKPAYTSQAWTLATGYAQAYIDASLNRDVSLCGVVTDFGHLIAALADQINQPGVKWSDLTTWTGDHTAWAGDVGSAIATYRSQPHPPKLPTVLAALDRYASDSDYAADILATVIGAQINTGAQPAIAPALRTLNQTPYALQIHTFLEQRFGRGTVVSPPVGGSLPTLAHPATLEAEIRKSVFTYLELDPDSGILRTLKQALRPQGQLPHRPSPEDRRTDLLQGSLHFMAHLGRYGNFSPISFKPYQLPALPWLGTVSYTVNVPC